MPYLKIEVKQVCAAWDDIAVEEPDGSEPVLAVAEQLDYGRRAVAVHVPQTRLHGVVCRNCSAVYTCRTARWGMVLLRQRGWDVADVITLMEAVQSGGRL